MHKRFLAATVLAVALLFSQVGSFLVAALCPHLRSGIFHCNNQLTQPATSHHDMGHMQMESLEKVPSLSTDPDAVALRPPTELCTHCAVHSRTRPNAVSLRETDAPKRAGDLTIPVTGLRIVSIATSPAAVLTSRAHGPPGEYTPRHILINIFRI